MLYRSLTLLLMVACVEEEIPKEETQSSETSTTTATTTDTSTQSLEDSAVDTGIFDTADPNDSGTWYDSGYNEDSAVELLEIQVLSPTSEMMWLTGSSQAIVWDAPESTTLVNISLLSTAGNIVEIASAQDNTGNYTWDIPLDIDLGQDYQLLVEDAVTTEINGTSEDSLHFGSLIGFQWNGTEEEILRYSPLSGDSHVIGTVGDLMWWSSQVVVDYLGEQLYIFGSTSDFTNKLYTIDMWTGDLVDEMLYDGAVGLQINNDGLLLYGQWTGTEQQLIAVDPVTGQESVLGVIGDLQSWSSQTVIDNKQNLLYVFGSNAAGENTMWIMDSLTGDLLDSVDIADEWPQGAQLMPNGNIVYGRWNGSEEEMVELDVTTGQVAVLGIVGDLMWWSGQTVMNPFEQSMIFFGNNSAQDYMYHMDLSTGSLLANVPLNSPIAAPKLVY